MSNRIWLDVYDNSTLLRLGAGPVFRVTRGSISRPLDGAGTFRVNCVATDGRALDLLAPNRIIRIWAEDGGGVRLRGEGIISDWKLTESPNGVSLIISGPDLLEELKRKNTLLGRIYNQQTVQTVADDLISLAPGWSVAVDGAIQADVIDARFDGISVFKAFRSIAKQYGFHIRASLDSTRTLEVGAFGESTGLRVHKVETVNSEALSNPQLLMVQEISETKKLESNNYYNVIIPTASGEGTAAVTLREAFEANGNTGRAYPIQTVAGPDGRTLYYVSTTSYPAGGYDDFLDDPGASVQVGQYKDIAPLSNSLADRRNASEALYAAAVSDLERSSTTQELYALTVKNVKENILPGDKIRIDYTAQIEQMDGTLLTYLDVRGDFFVLDADEAFGNSGTSVSLEVSNVDRFEKDEVELIFDTIDSMELRNLKPNITTGPPSPYVYVRNLANGFPAKIPVEFTDAVLELLRVRMRLQTRPFRATSQGAESGGGSTQSSSNVTITSGITDSTTTPPSGVPHNHDFTVPEHNHQVTLPNHTHPPKFGITDDSQTPYNITVHFEGNDVTNDLFGVATLAPTGGNINELADAGALADLFTSASGGLQQLHELEVRCASGRGTVEVLLEVFATTQAIKLG